MRRSLSTLTLLAVAVTLDGCLAQSFATRKSAAASGDTLRAPNDSVVVAYEAGRRAAMKAERRSATELPGWFAGPAGFLAGHLTHSDWVRAATAILISGSTVVVAYRHTARPTPQPPDSMRMVLGGGREWEAYRRGFRYEAESNRSTELTRTSVSAGGTILSGLAPLVSRSGTRP